MCDFPDAGAPRINFENRLALFNGIAGFWINSSDKETINLK
jgi:hypothetical protein